MMVALKSLLRNEDIALVVAFFFYVPQNNNEATRYDLLGHRFV